MVEFAEMIGCRQSTVSRYESGKLIPGRSVQLLILQLAQGAERKPILDALGVGPAAASGWPERDLFGALKTFEQYLNLPAHARARAPSASLAAFAKAAKVIVLERSEVDPAVVSIVQQWAQHGGNPKAVPHFRNIAAYLDVELSVLGASGRPRRRQRSRSSRRPRTQSAP
jgi:transcriptional regulator with XRE-family HTH domain